MRTGATAADLTEEDLARTFRAHESLPAQRSIPDPLTVSESARQWLTRFHRGASWADAYVKILTAKGTMPATGRFSVAEFRSVSAVMQRVAHERTLAAFPVTIREECWSGVEVFVVEPAAGVPEPNQDWLLINPPGNATILPIRFPVEAVPVAHLLKMRVVAVRYRHPPEHLYPAAPADVMAVYRHALAGSIRPERVGLFGTSSGALIALQFMILAARQDAALPGAMALLSPSDPAVTGDTHYTNADLDGTRDYLEYVDLPANGAVDEAASPLHSDLTGLPPTLMVSGTRDHLLSTTVLLHRALRGAGVSADLRVFEAMPHAHWYFPALPETLELYGLLGRFFAENLHFPDGIRI